MLAILALSSHLNAIISDKLCKAISLETTYVFSSFLKKSHKRLLGS